jgi:hypothetical protein
MIPIKRNGIFQYTEYLESSDIPVMDKPNELAELDELNNWQIDIGKVKQAKIQKFKLEIAPKLVYLKAPEYKQINSALGIYFDEEKIEIVNWIQAVRKLSDQVEAKINALEDVQQVDDFSLDFAKLKAKAEELQNGGMGND